MGNATVQQLLDAARDAPDNRTFNEQMEELVRLVTEDESAMRLLVERRGDLKRELNWSLVRLASTMSQLGALYLCLSRPVEPDADAHHPELAGGPSREIALAATYIIRHAHEIVHYDEIEPDDELEEPTNDPDFSSPPSIFQSAVETLGRASYYLLDARESYRALTSSPPEQETFPPLPFPVVWCEMAHLAPFLRFRSKDEGTDRQIVDTLGVLISEIEQGNVWDIYLPFKFDDDAEFFFLAARVTPTSVVSVDHGFDVARVAFDLLRILAVGVVHLITARNVQVEEVTLPRHQRKRIEAETGRRPAKLYFVNLSASGEHGASGGTREYHVRWLVRGHWRHVIGGKRFCTCCDPPQIASWVEPYIKGPAGAPWKGRQVRRQEAPPNARMTNL